MGLTAQLAAAAGIATGSVGSGSMDLIAATDAEAFALAAKNEGVVIVGIEGFYLRGGYIVPELDAIADFGGLPIGENLVDATYRETVRFLRKVYRADLYFDFIVYRLGEPLS